MKTRCEAKTRRGTACNQFLPCRYHSAKAARSAVPDADDFDAVNKWLRQIAIDALADHVDKGNVTAQTYDYFRRALESLHDEWREAHPPVSANDAIDKMMEVIADVYSRSRV